LQTYIESIKVCQSPWLTCITSIFIRRIFQPKRWGEWGSDLNLSSLTTDSSVPSSSIGDNSDDNDHGSKAFPPPGWKDLFSTQANLKSKERAAGTTLDIDRNFGSIYRSPTTPLNLIIKVCHTHTPSSLQLRSDRSQLGVTLSNAI
jgi:hypothetical protein